jgi:isoleucyl-tRNA synthetase
VHMTDWPSLSELPADNELVAGMDRVRQVASAALSLRKANKLRVRLPLAKLLIAAEDASVLAPFTELLADEVNVKQIELTTDVAAHGRFELAVNARACGPRLGGDTQKVIKAVKAGDWTASPEGKIVAAGIELLEGEYERRLVTSDHGAAAPLPGGSGLVLLDTDVARDLVRVVQQARRAAGLDVADRIALTLEVPGDVEPAARTHESFLASETLAESVSYGPAGDAGFAGSVGDGVAVRVAVVRT